MKPTAVLLLGYSRPDYIARRLRELSAIIDSKLKFIVSIDKFDGPNLEEIKEQYFQLRNEFYMCEWLNESKRLGLVTHLTLRVSEILDVYEKVIVIIDDIKVNSGGLESLIDGMEKCDSTNYLTLGMFGSIPQNPFQQIYKNCWRTTHYFSAWGWAITREKWALYSHEIVSKLGREKIYSTPRWKALSENQKRRWDYRFAKVESNPQLTWDYQMQFVTWLNNSKHLLPIYRMCDNEGFNDSRATNTSSQRPKWYVGAASSLPIDGVSRNKKPREVGIISRIDSYTWIGDRHPLDLIRKK